MNMAVTPGGMENLFSRLMFIRIKDLAFAQERTCYLNLSIEWNTVSVPSFRRELVIRLIDDADPLIFYILNLNDDDFQTLKTQQGLLVAFNSFPQKFIDLLELSAQDETKANPKYLLNFTIGTHGSPAQLDIVETNPFKHLIHLSLKMNPASDSVIKKYLTSCLKATKDERQRIENELKRTQADLTEQLRKSQAEYNECFSELNKLKLECHTQMSELTLSQAQKLQVEQNKLQKLQNEYDERWAQEKEQLSNFHNRQMKTSEDQLDKLMTENKELQNRNAKCEALIQELKNKVPSLEDELYHTRQKLQSLVKENTSLDADYHGQEKIMMQLKTKVVSLEQELKEKEHVLIRTQELLQIAEEQKQKTEQLNEQKNGVLSKRENALKTVSEDLLKSNEIIKKLQDELKNGHAKLKVKNKIVAKQEEVIKEKEDFILNSEKEMKLLKEQLDEKDKDVSKLKENLDVQTKKVEECQKQIKTNENVITWLNKQLNGITPTDNTIENGAEDVRVNKLNLSNGVPSAYQHISTSSKNMPSEISNIAKHQFQYSQSSVSTAPKGLATKPGMSSIPDENGSSLRPFLNRNSKNEKQSQFSTSTPASGDNFGRPTNRYASNVQNKVAASAQSASRVQPQLPPLSSYFPPKA